MSIVHSFYLVFQGMFPSVEGQTCASWQKCSLQICSVVFSVWVGIHGPRREAPIARICHHVPTWFIWAVDVAIKSAHLLRTKSLSHVRCPYRFKWHLQRCAGVHTASHDIDRPENLLSLLSLLSLRFVLKVTLVAVA